jgi:hypothetical protein
VVEFTRAVNFTMWESHSLVQGGIPTSHVRAGCDGTSPILASAPSLELTSSTQLAPGQYTFVACDLNGRFVAEATPVASNTNTSCGAAVIANTFTASHRVYDGTKLYLQFTASGPSTAAQIDVSNVQPPYMAAGVYRLEVQSTCDDRTTDLLDTGTTSPPGATTMYTANGHDVHQVTGLVVGTSYWAVLSEMSPGVQPIVTVQ